MMDGVLAGPLHYLLEQVTCGNKPAGGVEHDKVVEDCQLLVKAGEAKTGTDEKAFAKLFSERSREHLVFLNEEYKKHSPKKLSLQEAILEETGKRSALQLALLACIMPPAQWFAERYEQAMAGIGCDKGAMFVVGEYWKILTLEGLFGRRSDQRHSSFQARSEGSGSAIPKECEPLSFGSSCQRNVRRFGSSLELLSSVSFEELKILKVNKPLSKTKMKLVKR